MSVPFSKITAVGSVDQGRGLLGATSELIVKAGSDECDFEFRGGEKHRRPTASLCASFSRASRHRAHIGL